MQTALYKEKALDNIIRLDLVKIYLHAKNNQYIPGSLKVIKSGPFTEKFALARLFIKKSDIRQSHWLGLVNIYLHA